MSEEVAEAAGDIAYWRQRAEAAEADAAALRAALEGQLDPTRTIRDRHMEAYQLLEIEHPGAALHRQLATAQALEDYWKQRHADAWTLIGRLDYALEQIGAARGIRDARGWAWRMRQEIADRTKKASEE